MLRARGVAGTSRAPAEVAARHGVRLPQAAIAFAEAHPAVASVVLGMRSAEEVRHNTALVTLPIPASLWPGLVAEGLLPPDSVPSA